MEQLFWRNNGDREKARFLRRWEIFSRSKTSASEGRRIKLPFGSDKILLGSQFSRPRSLAKISNASQKLSPFLGVGEGLVFAKISNVIANRTFPRKSGRPRFLAKISNASQRWSLFLGVSEEFLDAKTLEPSRKGGSGDRNGSPLRGSRGLQETPDEIGGLELQIPFERRDKNKYIGEEIENE